MPYRTPYHDWPVPRDGEEAPPDGGDGPLQSVGPNESWGDILQTLADHLDGDIIRMGTEADRPASPTVPAGTEYVWYLSVDESPPGLRLYDVGNDAWAQINSGGGGDADTLDGYDSSAFGVLDEAETVTQNWTFAAGATLGASLTDDAGNTVYDYPNSRVPAARIHQGPNSGLNADAVDGYQGADLAALDEAETVTAQWAFQQGAVQDYSQRYPHSPRSADAFTWPAFIEHPGVENPIFTGGDFTLSTGNAVETVADPFIVRDGGLFYLFFEAQESTTPEQTIHYATSPDGLTWTHQGEVLNTAGSLSYPIIVKNGGTWYMMPDDTDVATERDVYTGFPASWSLAETIALGSVSMSDPTVWEYGGRWWLMWQDEDGSGNATIELAYADTFPAPTADWTMHPDSPILGPGTTYRPGGRPIVHEEYVDIPLQSSEGGSYGMRLDVQRFTTLDTSAHNLAALGQNPILEGTGANSTWNGVRMHHIDYILDGEGSISFAVTDGGTGSGGWSLGVHAPTAIDPIRASLGMTNGVSIAGGGSAELPMDQVFIDTHDGSDGAGDWVCPQTGWYLVFGQWGVSYSGSSEFRVTLDLQNRTTGNREMRSNTTLAAGPTYQSLFIRPQQVRLNEGDSYYFNAINAGSSSFSVNTGSDQTTVTIQRVPIR